MITSLERFRIVGLHGNKTVDIKIRDNTLILVGENGSGKTTILRILFHFLSGSWQSLLQSRFDEIVATIGGTEHKVTHTEIVNNLEISRHQIRDLPATIRRRVMELAETGQLDQVPIDIDLQMMIDQYGIPLEQIMRRIEMSEEMGDLTEKIQSGWNPISAQILYLPTYRRIERELDSILEYVGPDSFRRQRSRFRPRDRPDEIDKGFIELVEFGMKDVKNAIDLELDELKEFARENLNNLTLRYLDDVVNQMYQNVVVYVEY